MRYTRQARAHPGRRASVRQRLNNLSWNIRRLIATRHGRAACVGFGGVVRPPSAQPTLSQRRRSCRLYHAWRAAYARQRLHHLSRDLSTLTSRAAWAVGARQPRWGGAAASRRAAPQSQHSGAAAASSVAPGGLHACTSACITSAGISGGLRTVRHGRAARSGLGEVVWPPTASPTLSQASRHPHLYCAWRAAYARQRLHHLSRDISTLTSRAAWAVGARQPRWGGAAVICGALPLSQRRGAAAASSIAPGDL
jgi:hypothetical protein